MIWHGCPLQVRLWLHGLSRACKPSHHQLPVRVVRAARPLMSHFQVFALDSVEVLKQITVVYMRLSHAFVFDRCLGVFSVNWMWRFIKEYDWEYSSRPTRCWYLHGPHQFRVWNAGEPMRQKLKCLTLRKQHEQAIQSFDEIGVVLYVQ